MVEQKTKHTYIALLRGINISGSKLIKMEALRTLFLDLGFQRVQTYIQSGNVVFQTLETDSALLENDISKAILDRFGFVVPVFILDNNILQEILNNNPLLTTVPLAQNKELYFTLLKQVTTQKKVDDLGKLDFSPEKCVLQGKVVYLSLPNGYGNAKMHNGFFESFFKMPTTTRNWNTMNKLLALSMETDLSE